MLKRPVSGEVRRSDPNKYQDKQSFSRTADRTHYLNNSRRSVMRGGIRL